MDLLSKTIEQLLSNSPLIIVIAIYFIRLEKKITEINVDLKWIKKIVSPCQPTSDDHT